MNKTMTSYRMSETGACIKALTAARFGYEPERRTDPDDELRLRYYTRCEALAAAQITDEGFTLEDGGVCPQCEDRNGIHVEIDSALYKLVGHLDRRLILNGVAYPVEIKSLGRNSWAEFSKYRFERFPEYAAQEACYVEADGKPGIYWVLNRDTGRYLKFIINDLNDELNLPGFEKLTLPTTFEQIQDKLNMVEIYAVDGVLPEVEYDSERCRYCKFVYLCIVKTQDKPDVVDMTGKELTDAATLYREGKKQIDTAEEMVERAKSVLLAYAKQHNMEKFRVLGLSISYRGITSRKYLDEKKLRELVANDILKLAYRDGKSWENLIIRDLGQLPHD